MVDRDPDRMMRRCAVSTARFITVMSAGSMGGGTDVLRLGNLGASAVGRMWRLSYPRSASQDRVAVDDHAAPLRDAVLETTGPGDG